MRTVIILIVILLVVLAVGLWATQRRRTSQLRQRFGDEYDRTLARTGNRREAEQTLTQVADRHAQLDIRPLTVQQRQSWVQQWALVQARFVDSPAEAVAMARQLLPSLMRERGYPTDDADERAALLAVDHPVVVGEYRAAEQAYQRHTAGGSSTEALRQALVHYRALFDALVDPGTVPADGTRGDGVRADGARADGARADGAVAGLDGTHGRHADSTPVDTPVDERMTDNQRGVNR